ncbi:MAG: cold shock domain-containing protein [Deltaproteobacteria bacterium]|nr:cold shock domain-containing protein [Deltaproteobacteria bacterium]
MPQGLVKEYDPGKGIGIIETDQREEIPVHRSALEDSASQGLYAGDLVEFRIGKNRFGKRTALEVRRVGWEHGEGDEDDEPREWTF